MKKLTLVVLLLSVASCAFAKMAKKKTKQKATTEITSVNIHRTACFGQCPDYFVDINKDGTATYTAIRFTPDTGIFKKNIGKAKANEVIAMVRKYRLDTCKDMYENLIPDLPGLTITVMYGKKKKSIYSADFGPAFLKEIGEAVDNAGKKTDKAGWRKVGMPKMD